MSVQRAIFLDRDGVLNRVVVRNGTAHPPDRLSDLEILPGVPEALSQLQAAGYVLLVVTNQPDVARGIQTRDAVEQINRYLMKQLPLREVLTCYHDNADNCLCRKPKPGMIREAADRYGISLESSFMIGDRWSDIVAGAAAGCRTFLIGAPYSQAEKCRPDYTVADLPEASAMILDLVPSPLYSGERDRVRGDVVSSATTRSAPHPNPLP